MLDPGTTRAQRRRADHHGDHERGQAAHEAVQRRPTLTGTGGARPAPELRTTGQLSAARTKSRCWRPLVARPGATDYISANCRADYENEDRDNA